MRSAMVRAARRRGSSMMIFCPTSQGSSRRASGSKVLLPAPGGACTISVLRVARCSRTVGMISVTGRSIWKGLKGKGKYNLQYCYFLFELEPKTPFNFKAKSDSIFGDLTLYVYRVPFK